MDLKFTKEELSRAKKIVRRYDRDKKVGRWAPWILIGFSLVFIVLAFVSLGRSQGTLEIVEKREQSDVYDDEEIKEYIVTQDRLNRSYIRDYLISFILIAMYGLHLFFGILIWKRFQIEPIDVRIYKKAIAQHDVALQMIAETEKEVGLE